MASTPRGAKSQMSTMKIGLKHSSINAGLCGALALMAVMSALLYLSILMSPAIFRKIYQDVVACGSISRSTQQGDKEVSSLSKHDQVIDDHQLMRSRPSSDSGKHKFRILIGIFTTASRLERRTILRQAYATQFSPDAEVVVRYIMGRIGSEFKDDQDLKMYETLVGLENALHGDIMFLDVHENINSGKSYAFFSNLPSLGVHYDYVMKLDDDSYIRFENLASALKPLSRTDLYFGYVIPCESQNPHDNYMAGMGYLISWDLVEWIRDSPFAKNNTVGTEDLMTGKWFTEGGVAKNRVTKKPQFYDHVEFGGDCAHDFTPDTILVHQLKYTKRWADALAYFEKDRVAEGLSESRFPRPIS